MTCHPFVYTYHIYLACSGERLNMFKYEHCKGLKWVKRGTTTCRICLAHNDPARGCTSDGACVLGHVIAIALGSGCGAPVD